MNFAGVMRLRINSIGPGTTNIIVVGIIIAKQSPRVIVSKKDKKEISVFSFTIRDSPEDIINVNVWGSNDYIRNLYNNYKIGDVIDLVNSQVKYKPVAEDKYMPESTSAFLLTLNENSSQVLFHETNDSKSYKHLLRLLTCPKNMFLMIINIYNCGKELSGKFCNLLVVVRCVNPIKLIKTKNGKEIFLREIIVMDKTHPTLIVKIWDEEMSEKATQWITKKTILALANVYLEWNVYRKNITAVVSTRTIITEDPQTSEAISLKNYANTYSNVLSNKLNINYIPNLSTIIDVMSCKHILIKSNESGTPVQFTAILYAIISKFNIDGLFRLIFTRCNLCGMDVESTHLICLNPECPSNSEMGIGSDELESILNIRLSLTDLTGTLDNCILHHQIAAKILSKVNNFQNMSEDQKTELKWKYLFTNCAIKLVVSKSNPDEKSTIVVVDIDNEGPMFQFISRVTIN